MRSKIYSKSLVYAKNIIYLCNVIRKTRQRHKTPIIKTQLLTLKTKLNYDKNPNECFLLQSR